MTAIEIDFAAVKCRQQKTWASGDFSVVASRIVFPEPSIWGRPRTSRPAVACARRRHRQRQCRHRRSTAGLRGRRHRLRPGAAPARPHPRRGRTSSTSGSSRATQKTFAFPTPPSTPCSRSTGSCSPPTTTGPRPSWPGSAVPAGIALASWTPDGFIGETFRIFFALPPPPRPASEPARPLGRARLPRLAPRARPPASMTSHRRTAPRLPLPLRRGERRFLPRPGTGPCTRPSAPSTTLAESSCTPTCSPSPPSSIASRDRPWRCRRSTSRSSRTRR